MKETYGLEIMKTITERVPDLKLIKANYTVDGLISVVEDQYNKQKYEIKITPIKEAVQ